MKNGRKKQIIKKLRGGVDPNLKKKIVLGIYVFFGIVIAYLGRSADTTTLSRGFALLYSGQCNSMSELALDYMGMGNPICSLHHRIIVLIACALKGHRDALMEIVYSVSIVGSSPFLIYGAIDKLAGLIASETERLIGQQGLSIEDINRPITSQIQNQSNDIVDCASSSVEELADRIRNTPGLYDKLLQAIGQFPEFNVRQVNEELIETASNPNSPANSRNASLEFVETTILPEERGGRRKRSKSKRRKMTKKNKKYTRKNKKYSKKT